MGIGAAIRERRRELGMTREELAARSKVPYETVAQIERGRTKDPRVNTIIDLSKPLGWALPFEREEEAVEDGRTRVSAQPSNSPLFDEPDIVEVEGHLDSIATFDRDVDELLRSPLDRWPELAGASR